MTEPLPDPDPVIDSQVVAALAAALTPDQLVSGIANVLAAHRVEDVQFYLLALTRVDPRRAQQVLETLRVGLAMRAEQGQR